MIMKKIPILQTPRLILRPFKMSDAPVISELANDKEIVTNTQNLPYPYEEYMAEDWISHHAILFNENKFLNLAVVQRKKNLVMGAIGLEFSMQHDNAELGYWLGRPYWGQGYATEAAKRLLHYAFAELKLHRVHSIHLSINPASGRILQKIGMTHEGCMREHIKKWGIYENVDLYGILRREYENIHI